MWIVWVRGGKGPEPQIWHEINLGYDGWDATRHAVHVQLIPPNQRHLTLDELALLYPVPAAILAQLEQQP